MEAKDPLKEAHQLELYYKYYWYRLGRWILRCKRNRHQYGIWSPVIHSFA
jgi:hypothetical protein